MPRRQSILVPIASAFALALGITFAVAAPAAAHESLDSSSPSEGERLGEAPSSVELVFRAEVMDIGATVMVVDEAGRDWAASDPQVSGTTVTTELEPDMPEAGYQVRWRVVSGDGHPIESVIPFTVGEAEPFTMVAPVSAPASEDEAPADEAPTAAESSPATYGWLLPVGVGVAAIIAILLILFTARASHRRKYEQEHSDDIRDLLDD